jgi:putative flavoprotein involved in K+ transport
VDRYAAALQLPIVENTAVRVVEAADEGYRVLTDGGAWSAGNVVVATGACDVPAIPAIAAGLHPSLTQFSTSAYRNPAQLPPGGVLVVGASASGLQIADELRRAGREVVLATGSHTRLPRRYRGMDVMWWLETIGALDRSVDDVPDLVRARREPGGSRHDAALVAAHLDTVRPARRRAGVALRGRS